MICGFCDHEIEADKPEWVLVSKKPSVKHFCCLGCLSGYVDELELDLKEKTGLLN
ncbi:hypothetical protein ABHN04_26795 [Brevibacillus parabrevis]|uniref:hypothetical protein n=1 Tax=Brevibacillus TaxID=55080 RepID=UPI00257DED74|nr:hypothetical protein [Brevibacillus sp.]